MKTEMKKIIGLLLLLALYRPGHLSAQQAIPAAAGIYIDLGTEIPRQHMYIVSRRENGSREWTVLQTLRFEADSSLFYVNLAQAASHYATMRMPEQRLRGGIWQMVRSAPSADSVIFYGRTPAYREALQTAYYDDSALPNVSYEYKVATILLRTKEQVAETQVKARYPADVPSDFQLKTQSIQAHNGQMVLKYRSSASQQPTGVIVLRSTYMQTDFETINGQTGIQSEGDTLFYTTVDSLIQPEQVYQYVAIPFDQWGNEGVPSDTIRVANTAFNNSPALISVQTQSLEKESAIRLSWKLDSTAHVNSLVIYRSENYDGADYVQIGTVPASDTVFLDQKAHPVKTYYYSIVPQTQYGSGYPSSRIAGMLKANQKAVAVSRLSAQPVNGKIRLSWQKPDFYTRGYYVYRSKDGTDTLKQVSNLIISDSVQMLYEDTPPIGENGLLYTYAVRAVNTSYDISALSEQVMVTTPLAVKLLTPVNLQVRVLHNKLMLYWDNHADPNCLGFDVFRRPQSDKVDSSFSKLTVNMLPSSHNSFEDSTAIPGMAYTYALQAITVNGQRSSLSTGVSTAGIKQTLLPVYQLSAHPGNSGIMLRWDKTEQSEVTEYRIYRLEGGHSTLIGTVNANESPLFEDKSAKKTVLNTYAISCKSDHVESSLSDPVSLRLE